LKFGSDGLDFVHHPEQVAAPELFDLRFRVAAAGDLQGQFESFAGVVPAEHAKDRFNGELHNTECYFSVGQSPPELLRGQARTFGHGVEFCPDDLRMNFRIVSRLGGEAAVAPRDDVFPAY
jgi:hypothetical protein